MVVGMAKDTTFQLDTTAAGQEILQKMAAELVRSSGQAIMDRANNMATSQSSEVGGFRLSTKVGTIKRGVRAIATVTANDTGNAHASYIARMALLKAKDAGRV